MIFSSAPFSEVEKSDFRNFKLISPSNISSFFLSNLQKAPKMVFLKMRVARAHPNRAKTKINCNLGHSEKNNFFILPNRAREDK